MTAAALNPKPYTLSGGSRGVSGEGGSLSSTLP